MGDQTRFAVVGDPMRRILILFMIVISGSSGCVSTATRIKRDMEREQSAKCEQDRRDMMEALAFRDNEIKNLKRDNIRLEDELTAIKTRLLKK